MIEIYNDYIFMRFYINHPPTPSDRREIASFLGTFGTPFYTKQFWFLNFVTCGN